MVSSPAAMREPQLKTSGRRAHRRVVQNRPDITVLHLVERIDALHTVAVELVEHKADTSTAVQLVQRQVRGNAVDGIPELRRELGDDGQDDVACVTVGGGTTERGKLCVELLELLRDAHLDVREGGTDVLHKELGRMVSMRENRCGRRRTVFSLRARYGVPQ